MPVRDGERFLQKAIDSVLTQTFGDFEFIIVDDGSRDATAEILAAAAKADSRIAVVRQQPMGLVAALNRGIAGVRSPYIARLDADDISLPTRLARQLEFMRGDTTLGLLGSYAEEIDEHGRALAVRKPPVNHESLVEALEQGNPFIHSTILVRTDLVRACGGFRAALAGAEDYDLWLRISERARVANVPETLVRYRVHAQTVTELRTVRMAFSVRIARRAAAARKAGRSDPLEGLAAPPDWRTTAFDSFLAPDARDFRLLEFADRTNAANLDPASLDPAIFEGLAARLDHGERRLAQRALLHLLRRKDRPSWLGRMRILTLLVSLHPARAAKLLAQAAIGE
jgi:glycosyltransferase involved in cell wall biosynthesis